MAALLRRPFSEDKIRPSVQLPRRCTPPYPYSANHGRSNEFPTIARRLESFHRSEHSAIF